MHYKDGTPVQLNDLCMNSGTSDYQPIVGYVRQLILGAQSCNMIVACLGMTYETKYVEPDKNPGLPSFPIVQLVTVTAGEFSLLFRKK